MPRQPASTKTPERPVYPALSSWAIKEVIKKLRENYQHDQKSKPAEILSSSTGCPEVEAIRYRVTRLKQYEQDVRRVFEGEIKAGRAADTAEVWMAVLSQKILPLIRPRIQSLKANLEHKLWEIGGGHHGERAAVEWALGELDRLNVDLGRELEDSQKHARNEQSATDNQVSSHVATSSTPAVQTATGVTRGRHIENSKVQEGNRPVIWPGTARQLGDEIIEQYRKGKIGAKSENDAIKQACLFFLKKDGSSFSPRSIVQSLRNRKEIEDKGPSARSRALSTLVKRFANVTTQRYSL